MSNKTDAQQAPICWLKRHITQDLKEVFFDKAEADAWVAQFQPGFAWLEEMRIFPAAPVQRSYTETDLNEAIKQSLASVEQKLNDEREEIAQLLEAAAAKCWLYSIERALNQAAAEIRARKTA